MPMRIDMETSEPPYPVGTWVYIREVAYHVIWHVTGQITGARGRWLKLANAAHVSTHDGYGYTSEWSYKTANVQQVSGDGTMSVNMDNVVDVVVHPNQRLT